MFNQHTRTRTRTHSPVLGISSTPSHRETNEYLATILKMCVQNTVAVLEMSRSRLPSSEGRHSHCRCCQAPGRHRPCRTNGHGTRAQERDPVGYEPGAGAALATGECAGAPAPPLLPGRGRTGTAPAARPWRPRARAAPAAAASVVGPWSGPADTLTRGRVAAAAPLQSPASARACGLWRERSYASTATARPPPVPGRHLTRPGECRPRRPAAAGQKPRGPERASGRLWPHCRSPRRAVAPSRERQPPPLAAARAPGRAGPIPFFFPAVRILWKR